MLRLGAHMHSDDGIGKFVIRKTMAAMSIWMISKRERSGYEIIKAFAGCGMLAATPSRIYPLLAGMEKAKVIRSRVQMQGKRRTKVYSITPKGRKVLTLISEWLSCGMRGQFFREMVCNGSRN